MSHPDPGPTSPAPRRGGAGLTPLLVLLVGVLGAALGYVAAVNGPPWLRPARTVAAPPPAQAAAPQVDLDQRLADIQALLPAPRAGPDPVIVRETEVQALGDRLSIIEQRQEAVLNAAAAALAIAALDQAAQHSGSFAPQLAEVEQSLPASPELLRLTALAPQGAPSRALLAAAFPEAARQAVTARQASAPGDGWLARLTRALETVVVVRRLDASGRGIDATLARAQGRLEDGDLGAALAELQSLPAPARQAMAPWIAHAQRRLEVDRDLAALRIQAVRRLAEERLPPTAEPAP